MKRTYKIIRAIIVSLLALILLVPVTLYVTLSLPSVQEKICTTGEDELSRLLDTEVRIGRVSIAPFNRITLNDVTVFDSNQDTALHVSRIGAGISLPSLVSGDRITITYTELIGMDARLSKPTPDSPLNIQPIIDALKPKDKTKPPTLFDLRVNTIVIRKSNLSYDILSEPGDSTRLDKNHIAVKDMKADIMLPCIKNDDFTIDIKRFALQEQSGFTLQDLKGLFHISADGLSASGVRISMPDSEISLSDIGFTYSGWDGIKTAFATQSFELSLLPGSHISPNDLSSIAPMLKGLDQRVDITCNISGQLNHLDIDRLCVTTPDESILVNIAGHIDSITDISNTYIDLPTIRLNANGDELSELLDSLTGISPKQCQMIAGLGKISADGTLQGSAREAGFSGNISSSAGNIAIDTDYARDNTTSPVMLSGQIVTRDTNLKYLTGNNSLGTLDADVAFDITYSRSGSKGNIDCNVNNIDFKDYRYSDITAHLEADNNAYNGTINIDDDNIRANVSGEATLDKAMPRYKLHADLKDINLATLNIWKKFPDNLLSATIDADFTGNSPDYTNGQCTITGIKYINNENVGLIFDGISIETDNTSLPQYLSIESDVIDGRVEGSYNTATIAPAIRDIMSHVFPVLMASDSKELEHLHKTLTDESVSRSNDFTYNFTLKDNEQLGKFFNTPVNIIYPITISGAMSHTAHCLSFNINAPYIQQKNKLIKNTSLHFNVDGLNEQCQLYATSVLPTKKGPMTMLIDCNGHNDRIDSDISWTVQRERTFKGDINFSTAFSRDEESNLSTGIDINPSMVIFNDTTWTISPAKIDIDIAGKYISVDGFDARRDNQYITLSGTASQNAADSLCLKLQNIDLDYVFETLAIGNVTFGGTATGTFYASDIFSKTPHAMTPGLEVKNLSYNHGVLGDAVIKSQWRPEEEAVTIDADISQANGHRSRINGAIFPLNDSLDFNFDADKINIQFMKPFMQAFTSDINGMASGKARLWGNFKYIDMTGDIYAEDLKLKLDFTNTYYHASDSVHLTPGHITFNNVELKDIYGNRAMLSGWLTHECFKRPKFEFAITDASNLLCYDVTEKMSPIWFGRIFGYGSAFVTGRPGHVGINVTMSTAPQSIFTFVLSDAEEANEYSFLTFRDKDSLKPIVQTDATQDTVPDIIKQLEARIASTQNESSSVYKMDIQVDVTPNAQMILVMDPIGGDRIRANGSGTLRMEYDSANEELKMFGTYTLERGNYNFTLQDIIIKEFSIINGSSIAFRGDPYAAQLDIDAIYSVNANITDLDESFLQDKDVNRTNVPVHAILKVNGDMRQPDINFDIDLPTVSKETNRKVKSIISTEDMMNRQIIYLLALNRFYTPEYMASTTKGSELVSVASSTISSQLSSILGQLSDNWSIAPNFRSDRGDFSDMEVDLALSSTLLNNRLLFNGNFGYRDKTLNNNTFIGDFDIEYLLSNSGHLRLKAYNRYNDQNYYLKTASTTQGVGIVYKRNFDNIFSFLDPYRRKKKTTSSGDSTAVDTPAVPADSTVIR